jgi:surface protein
MRYIFAHCKQLQDISALANWDVSNVKDMESMFNECETLKNIIPLASWDVSNANQMNFMFKHCHQLHDISALANWDVSNVNNMYSMFSKCYQLQDITALANWNVLNVRDMRYMFRACHQLNISDDDNNTIKSYLHNLPRNSYPKQDHISLLQSLWERVKPLLKYTTQLNNYFKRYAKFTLTDLPSDWQNVELIQWNP